jgi:hypothetical protein
MGVVMVKCPYTGHDISTGMVADRPTFNAMPVFFARVDCPMCGKIHEWFARQAWVCDGEPEDDRNPLLGSRRRRRRTPQRQLDL